MMLFPYILSLNSRKIYCAKMDNISRCQTVCSDQQLFDMSLDLSERTKILIKSLLGRISKDIGSIHLSDIKVKLLEHLHLPTMSEDEWEKQRDYLLHQEVSEMEKQGQLIQISIALDPALAKMEQEAQIEKKVKQILRKLHYDQEELLKSMDAWNQEQQMRMRGLQTLDLHLLSKQQQKKKMLAQLELISQNCCKQTLRLQQIKTERHQFERQNQKMREIIFGGVAEIQNLTRRQQQKKLAAQHELDTIFCKIDERKSALSNLLQQEDRIIHKLREFDDSIRERQEKLFQVNRTIQRGQETIQQILQKQEQLFYEIEERANGKIKRLQDDISASEQAVNQLIQERRHFAKELTDKAHRDATGIIEKANEYRLRIVTNANEQQRRSRLEADKALKKADDRARQSYQTVTNKIQEASREANRIVFQARIDAGKILEQARQPRYA